MKKILLFTSIVIFCAFVLFEYNSFIVYVEKAAKNVKINFTTTEDPLIEGINRFEWYRETYGSETKNSPNVSTLYAYEYNNEISVSLTSTNRKGYKMYCRYLNADEKEIGDAFESLSYPEYIVNCPKRQGTLKIGISVDENGPFVPLPLINRENGLKYKLSMCVTPLYGEEPKWLLITEMIEHYKLQGVQHFYMYIHNATIYDLKVINDYVRTGEVEVHYLLERDERNDQEWQPVHITDCNSRARGESEWVIFADIDERILMTKYSGRIIDYVGNITNNTIGGIQFRQQWILKTELLPKRFENEKQIDNWMPTRRWHNTSGIGPPGHTAKCIIRPSAVFIMWVHDVIMFYPGHGYYMKEVSSEEGLVRHYRDQTLGDWGNRWLEGTLKFGKLTMTDYPKKFLNLLTENVKRRISYVYANAD